MKRLILFTLICVFAADSSGQGRIAPKCEPPNASVTSSITVYAMKKYHVVPGTDVKLVESVKANDECYWKYHFEAANPKSDILLYLAPDHRYLSTALYDRLSDPLAEEKLQQEEMAKLLIGSNSPSRGAKTPAVTIVEFSDFQCPYCQKLADILEREVLPEEPDVRVVFRNFPLPIHPFARHAAEVAGCAAMQNNKAFWNLHDYIFSHQKELTADNIEGRLMDVAGQQSGIDHKLFQQCLEEGFSVGPVMKDEELGHKFGVRATPTLFINGSRVEGVRDAVQLRQLIAAAKAGQLLPTPVESQQIANSARPSVAGGNGCGVPATQRQAAPK